MSALKGLNKLHISNELLLNYRNLFVRMGEAKDKIEYLSKNSKAYNELAKCEDIKHVWNMFFKDAKIKDSRANKILKNQDLGQVLTKGEILFKNLKNVFDRANSSLEFNFDEVELTDLAKLIYKGCYSQENGYKDTKDKNDVRHKLETLIREYKEVKDNVEPLCLYTNFYVDFMQLSPYKYGNEVVAIIFFYCLLQKSNINCFKFYSFFEKLEEHKDEFEKATLKAFYLYDEGYSDSSELIRLFIRISVEAYEKTIDLYNAQIFNKQLKKSMNVEEVIYSLDEVFSKHEIMERLPGISMSTVDRKLKEMQEDGKISSYGTGRNAKWVLLDHSRKKGVNFNDTK